MPTIIAAFALLLTFAFPAFAQEKGKDSVYDRVMQTGVIRCGYIDYPPHMIIDPVTGEKSGIMHDIAEEMGALLEMEIEWAEELGWATTVTSIRTGRVDAICTSFWQNPLEGKHLGFTIPLFYSAVGAYVRPDDDRFSTDMELIDDPAVKISAADGSMALSIAKQDFPKAGVVSLPNMTDETQLLMEVKTGKADVTFVETYLGEKFIQSNPGALKNVAAENPVRLFGNTIAIPNDDVRFQSMLNSALVQLLYGGRIDKIIKKYEEVEGGIYRVSKPYAMPVPGKDHDLRGQ